MGSLDARIRRCENAAERAEAADAKSAAPPAWVPLDPETDRGKHGLTPLLLHRLGQTAGTTTYAQQVAQKLIELALDGHFGSLNEILTRIDGDSKNAGPATMNERAKIPIDNDMADKVLDVVYVKANGSEGS